MSLLFIDGCPHREVAAARLNDALRLVGGSGRQIQQVLISSDEDAQAHRFRGSPTILIDGRDPFDDGETPDFGLTCRVYATPDGLAGAPTVQQLVTALRANQ